jgi:hypothetical protein
MKVRCSVHIAAGVLLLACAPAVPAQDQVIGLLTQPEVVGSGPCDEFAPGEITLYAGPESRRVVGSVRVDEYWTFHEAGGCEGLKVSVHEAGSGRVSELPAREHDYEAPAAIVLARQGRWFQVRLAEGAAWLEASARSEYLPLEELLTDRLTYLTRGWDGTLAAAPGAAARGAARETARGGNVRVVGFRRSADRLWVEIEVLSHSICESLEEPTVTDRGWVPAHAPSGEPTIWFFSRGC